MQRKKNFNNANGPSVKFKILIPDEPLILKKHANSNTDVRESCFWHGSYKPQTLPDFSPNKVFSPRIIQGMMGGHGLGVACGHIEVFGLFPFPHQRKTCVKACRANMP